MKRLVGLLGIVLLLAAAPCWGQESDRTPSEQQEALVKEYQTLLDAFEKAYKEIQGEARQEAFFEKNHPQPERFYPRFMALAEKHPQDPAAVDALIWVITHSFYESRDEATQKKAFDLLREDHLTSEKLPLVFDWADENFLREVLEKSPHRTIRGLAGYTLAEKQLLRLQMISRWRAEYPDWQKRWAWLKQTQNAYLVTTDVDQAAKENEKLLERVVRDFGDVPIEERKKGKTLGELAKGHLLEIRKLGIGQPAPNLKCIDLEGQPVELTDLKGRVVMLDVWATWCGPCLSIIPQQRKLVKRLEGKPFTLVSISVDENRETVTEFLKKEPMPWTHWFNGPEGNIITELNVWGYPRIYVLDANGVIRYKGGALDMRGKVLDQTLDALLKEVEEQSISK